MRTSRSPICLLVLAILLPALSSAQAPQRLLVPQAADHVGEAAQVCGVIVDARYVKHVKGSPTYLNFDEPYPDSDFTVIVWGRDRKHFPGAPEALLNHKACVTGQIESYKGKPQIIAKRPEQILFWPLEPKPED